MLNEITLSQYITYAGNLFKCIFKRTAILQKKVEGFSGISNIAKQQIIDSMEEVLEDSQSLELETEMHYEEGFPHATYWEELKIYIDKYKTQPWNLYAEMKNRNINGLYSSFLYYYAKGLVDDIILLEGWASEVRI